MRSQAGASTVATDAVDSLRTGAGRTSAGVLRASLGAGCRRGRARLHPMVRALLLVAVRSRSPTTTGLDRRARPPPAACRGERRAPRGRRAAACADRSPPRETPAPAPPPPPALPPVGAPRDPLAPHPIRAVRLRHGTRVHPLGPDRRQLEPRDCVRLRPPRPDEAPRQQAAGPRPRDRAPPQGRVAAVGHSVRSARPARRSTRPTTLGRVRAAKNAVHRPPGRYNPSIGAEPLINAQPRCGPLAVDAAAPTPWGRRWSYASTTSGDPRWDDWIALGTRSGKPRRGLSPIRAAEGLPSRCCRPHVGASADSSLTAVRRSSWWLRAIGRAVVVRRAMPPGGN